MERAEDRLLYTAAPPPTSGTITFLLVDLTSEARTEAGVPCATVSDELSRRLRAELRRHGGGQLRADPGLLVAAFGRASDAGTARLRSVPSSPRRSRPRNRAWLWIPVKCGPRMARTCPAFWNSACAL